MTNLHQIELFIAVVRAGSFSAAARASGTPVSTISQRVAELEKRLGTVLLNRTTRRLSLTEAGEAYFETAGRLLGELRFHEAELTRQAAGLTGTLRVASSTAMDEILAPVLASFLRAHPKLSLELHANTRNADLISERIDLAIRFGSLPDNSALVVRSVGSVAIQLVASPTYLASHAPLLSPDDLRHHDVLTFIDVTTLSLASGSKTLEIPVEGRFRANQVSSLCLQALSNMGIAAIPGVFVANDVRLGHLVVLLPEWRGETAPIQLVFLRQRIQSPRLRTLIDHLVAQLPAKLR